MKELTYTATFESGDEETFALEYSPRDHRDTVIAAIESDLEDRLSAMGEEANDYGELVRIDFEGDEYDTWYSHRFDITKHQPETDK